MATMEQTPVSTMTDEQLDQSITQAERLYQTLTGREAPQPGDRPYAPIPAERDPASHVEEQLERLLRMLGSPAATPEWTPPLTAWESDENLLVAIEVPGVSREQLEVTLAGNTLTVHGRRASNPSEGDRFRLRLSERPFGMFRRTVLLPRDVVPGQVEAQLRDGLLEIRLRRQGPRETESRTVPIT